MTELKLAVGRTYRAKRPGKAGSTRCPVVNDRTVLYLYADGTVQYDGPAVKLGAHYPKLTKEQFLGWAAADVTDKLPDGEYQPWEKRND